MLKNILIILFLTFSIDSFAKEIKVISDTHCYGPKACKVCDENLLTQKFDVSLGDIYDIKWTLEDELDKAIKAQSEFSEGLKNSGIPEIDGNHDLKKHPTAYCIKNGVLYIHSFDLSWKNDEYTRNVLERREGKKGANIVTRAGFYIIQSIHPPRSEKKMVKAAEFANQKKCCSTVVFGHTHIKELSNTTIDGIRVINVPRGITSVNVDENMNSPDQNGCFDIEGNRVIP